MKGLQENGGRAELLAACVLGSFGGLKALVSTSIELRRFTGRRLFRLECVGCL